MLDDITYDIIRRLLNVLIVSCAPLIGIVAIAGILMGILQSATSVFDGASAYAVRLLALCAIVYFMAASVANTLASLFSVVFTSIGNIH